MKLQNLTPNKIEKNFEIYTNQIEKALKKGQKTDLKDFTTQLHNYTALFERAPETDKLVKKTSLMAERIVGYGKLDFASVIYSFLLKTVKNQKLIEDIAMKQLALAKRINDPIHIMARTADIRKIYQEISPKSPEHIKWMRAEIKSIRRVINHYEHSKNNYQTITRNPQPKEFYEKLLGTTLVDLGKILKQKEPKEALPLFEEAQEIFKKQDMKDSLNFTKVLIQETQEKLK